MYVLQKDLTKPGFSPYVLDKENGDMPRSSIDVMVKLKHSGETRLLKLEEYLSIPPPRTTQISLIKHMLEKQHPTEIKAKDIETIVIMPFVEGGIVMGRSTSGVVTNKKESTRHVMFTTRRKSIGARSNNIYRHVGHNDESDEDQDHGDDNNNGDDGDDEADVDGIEADDETGFDDSAHGERSPPNISVQHAKKEMSSRYPYIKLPDITGKWIWIHVVVRHGWGLEAPIDDCISVVGR